jgi:hypothetical protein
MIVFGIEFFDVEFGILLVSFGFPVAKVWYPDLIETWQPCMKFLLCAFYKLACKKRSASFRLFAGALFTNAVVR